ncbi:hypothetical protein Dsin_000159 [Dipteronia sinensis]|uniref:Uncharacterized protein n=1 Tax=Dipteronia sinensis TaxID=43782 RepID=A0AAD9Z675_9ROSI|nr:hypothetical protein Dsin_000159 [Dipteronia sinensis]
MAYANMANWRTVEALLLSYQGSDLMASVMYVRLCEAVGCQRIDLVRNLVEAYKSRRMGRAAVRQRFKEYMYTFYGNVADVAGCMLYIDNKLENGLRETGAVDTFCFTFREMTNSEDVIMKIVKAIKHGNTNYQEASTEIRNYLNLLDSNPLMNAAKFDESIPFEIQQSGSLRILRNYAIVLYIWFSFGRLTELVWDGSFASIEADSVGSESLSSPFWVSSAILGDWMWQRSSQLDGLSDQNIKHQNSMALLNRVGYTPEISHGVLVTKPILDTLRSYQDLPLDKALTALAIHGLYYFW